MDIKFKYRTWYKGQPPRRIKLEAPGWAGEKTNDYGQPWHCKPFIDGATYGYEILYPFETEVRVRCDGDDGVSQFLMESNKEWDTIPDGMPMANFAPGHFGFTSSLDIQTEPGWGIMILPHPRFFTDRTGTVPLPSMGLIESDIWPKIFFIPFRAPLKGTDYIFRKGEGIAQIIFVPKEVDYTCTKMTDKESHQRAKGERALRECGDKIFTKQWKDAKGHGFDNKYKMLSQMAKKMSPEEISNHLSDLADDGEAKYKKIEEDRREKVKCRFVRGD